MARSSMVRGPVLKELFWKEAREVLPGVLLLGGMGAAAITLEASRWWVLPEAGGDDLASLLVGLFGGLAVFYFGVRAAASDAADGTRTTLRALPTQRWTARGVRLGVGLLAVGLVVGAVFAAGWAAGGISTRTSSHGPSWGSWWFLQALLYLCTVAAAGSASSLPVATGRVVAAALALTLLSSLPIPDLLSRMPGASWGRFGNSVRAAGEGGIAAAAILCLLGWVLVRPDRSLAPALIGVARGTRWLPAASPIRWNATPVLVACLVPPMIAGGWLVLRLLQGWPSRLYEPDAAGWVFLLAVLQAAALPLCVFGRELAAKRPWFWRSLPLGGARWFTTRFATALTLTAAGWGVALLVGWLSFRYAIFDSRRFSEGLGFSVMPTLGTGTVDEYLAFYAALPWTLEHPFLAATTLAAALIFAIGTLGAAWSRRPLESGVVALAVVACGGLLAGVTPQSILSLADPNWWRSGGLRWPYLAAAAAVLTAWPLAARSFHRRVA